MTLFGDRNSKYDALVIGVGEVGKAISAIFHCQALDISGHEMRHVDYLHICFGWSEEFESEVKRYQALYTPLFTIIHSTVPVGTSSRLGAVHSPIRGMHPELELGVRTHVKFLGGPEAWKVAEYFRDFGLRIMLCDKSETTELGMLLGTECYRVNIEFAKHAKELCEKHQVPFNESYTLFANEYNEGWKKLGRPEYVRQVLVPIMGPIGGHCLESNKELIKKNLP
ncbi:MAG: hypothetical protein EOM12_03700 [Verrucomicrobiae bacterium]|nr:hypothetical protein [Verrucomicrobiae bacterium]